MFRFADLNKVLWPVELPQRDEDGSERTVTVHLLYTLLPRRQLRERERVALERMAARKEAGATGDELAELIAVAEAATEREDGDIELLLDHVSDWRGFVDGDGSELAYSRDRLAALLEFDLYFKPIIAGLHAASRHGPAKNSSPGPGGTPARVQA